MLGIMQGRLTDKEGKDLQSFPSKSWQEEFQRAADIGFNSIEWLIDSMDTKLNPIFEESKISQIKSLEKSHGISVESSCFHYIDAVDMFTRELNERSFTSFFIRAMEAVHRLGIKRVVIPMFEKNSPRSIEQITKLERLLYHEGSEVQLLLETDLASESILSLFEQTSIFDGIVFDIGNLSTFKPKYEDEFEALNHLIREVHIKDKTKNLHNTCRLGSGNVDFEKFIEDLKSMKNFDNIPIILETPTLDDWKIEATHNRNFILSYLSEGKS